MWRPCSKIEKKYLTMNKNVANYDLCFSGRRKHSYQPFFCFSSFFWRAKEANVEIARNDTFHKNGHHVICGRYLWQNCISQRAWREPLAKLRWFSSRHSGNMFIHLVQLYIYIYEKLFRRNPVNPSWTEVAIFFSFFWEEKTNSYKNI